MKKILLALSLTLILASCTGKATDSGMDDKKTSMNSGISKYQTDLDTVSSKISTSEEFKSCMDMNVPMCIQSAGMQLAQQERSTEFCSELPEVAQQESCVFAVTLIKAQEKNDITFCESLTGEYGKQCKISLIRNDAMTKKDPKICESIPTTDTENANVNIQDECKLSVLVSDGKNTKANCDIISNAQVKEMCTNMLPSTAPSAPEAPAEAE